MKKSKLPIKKKRFKNQIALACTFISFLMFFPGILLPMLKIHSSGKIESAVTSDIAIHFFSSTNSILNTVHELFIRNNKFVACMIFLFSIIVPVVKSILFAYVLLTTKPVRKKVFDFVKSISKWSMCDVYVVAVFLTYFSSRASNKNYSREVMFNDHAIDVDILVRMTSKLGVGFYYFLAYCLLSLIAFQLYDDGFQDK